MGKKHLISLAFCVYEFPI